MKRIWIPCSCWALFGVMGFVISAQETSAQSQSDQQQSINKNNKESDEEVLQKSVWRRYFGDDFEIFIGQPEPQPQQHLPGPGPQPFPNNPSGHYDGIANELEFIEHLWSENDRVDEYKTLAKRSYLSETDQILYVNSAYSSLDFDRNISEVLIALIANPCFSEGARDAILDGLNQGKIWDSSRRKKIFEVLENRGEILPSPRDPQRWIAYHFSRFQRALNELSGKYNELERRLLELEKKTHQLAEFDRRILDLEKKKIPPMPVGLGDFDKRISALEKRTPQSDEFQKRITLLESRIQAPMEFEKRISALEKAIQQRPQPAPPAQPTQGTEIQKQLDALEAKVKQLEAEIKRVTPKPRVSERSPAP